MPLDTKKKPLPNQVQRKTSQKVEEIKPKLNTMKTDKRFLLSTLNEDGSYEPCSEEEFAKFKRENPAIAKYLEITTDDNEDVLPLSNLPVPELPESTVIFD